MNIKYYDKLVIVEGCKYYIGRKAFPSMEQAIGHLQSIPREKRLKRFGRMINILIENKNPLPFNEKTCIPKQLLQKDSKDVLCIYAKERQITFSLDLDEIYTECFVLDENGGPSGSVHIFDYGFLYGNYPKYTGKELCVSGVSPEDERHVTFVPEGHGGYGIDYADAPYGNSLHDLYMAYDCYFIHVLDDGTVYDDGNGGFPFDVIPVSTFVNIGQAGVYLKCWDKLTESVYETHACYYVNAKAEYLFRNALLDCKGKELPSDQEYHTITVLHSAADGQIPSDFIPCSGSASWAQLYPHAHYRTICIAPSFDAVYWETFELTDAAGQTHRFCYDYGLLDTDPSLQTGVTYQTDYWKKTGMGISDKASIILTELPDSAAVFDAATGIDYCCKGYLPNDPDKAVCIPSCTLYK